MSFVGGTTLQSGNLTEIIKSPISIGRQSILIRLFIILGFLLYKELKFYDSSAESLKTL
jgi:hypothetical protein